MNKLLMKVAGIALGLSLATGIGVAVGGRQNVQKADASSDFSEVLVSSSSSTYYQSGYFVGSLGTNKATWSGTHFTAEQAKNTSSTAVSLSYAEIRVYASHSFMINPASGYEIDSVVITAGSNSYANAVGGTSLTNCTKSVSDSTVTLTPTDGTKTVGFTNSAQSRLNYVTVNYSAESTATLSSISLSGTMTKTSYTTADDWDPTGLIVTGTYSDSSSKNLTAGATFTFYDSNNAVVARPKNLGTGSGKTLKVVASYPGVNDTAKYTASSSIEVVKALEYELVTDVSKLTKGTTFLLVGTGSYTPKGGSETIYTRAMKQSRTTSNSASGVATVDLSDNFNIGSVATSAEATVFTLGGSAGAWTIKNGNNFLGFTGSSNNNMQFNEDQSDTFKITVHSGYLLSIESNSNSGRKLQYNVNNGDPRFSNYNGGQTYVYMFADIAEVSYGTTNHISVSTLPETEFAVGETFNSTGIVITAWDGSDENDSNSKLVTPTSISLSGTTFDDNDIGHQTVTVSYTENQTNFETTYDIYVYASATYKLVTSEPSEGWVGSYLITYDVSSATESIPETGTYAMKSSLANFDVVGNFSKVNPTTSEGVTTIVAGQHLQWSIASVSGGYSLQGHSGKYIGWNSSSSNGLTTSNSALTNTISISNGDVTILCNAGTKGLTLSTASGQFRYYSNATVKLYKLVESTEAVDYAEAFLDMLSTGSTPICQVTEQGVVETDLEDLQVAWAILAEDFNSLSSNAIKQQFTQGTADETSEDKISQALALYDHIARVYNTQLESQDLDDYDFMGRGITPSNGGLAVLPTVENEATGATVTVITLTSVAAVGGFFFLRKRRLFK